MQLTNALKEDLDGEGIRRESWENINDYVTLKNGILTIYTKGKFHSWIISEDDLEATNWVVA